MTELQLALDFLTLDAALSVASDVASECKRLECGTPLLLQEGLEAVSRIKRQFGRHRVVADVKIADAGEAEAALAFRAGADVVTVLSSASDETVQGAVAAASASGRVMVDLLNHPHPIARACELKRLGVHELCVHAGMDVPNNGTKAYAVWRQIQGSLSLPVALAGGMNAQTLLSLKGYPLPSIVIVGRAITEAADPKAAATQLTDVLAELEAAVSPAVESHALASQMYRDVLEALDQVSAEQESRFLGALLAASRLFVCGQGRSGLVAQAFAVRLAQMGLPTYVVGMPTTPPLEEEDDVLVACSGSGKTSLTVHQAVQAKDLGATVIGITASPDSPLAAISDVPLYLSVEARQGDRSIYSGTLFEEALLVYSDTIVFELMRGLGQSDEGMMARHANL